MSLTVIVKTSGLTVAWTEAESLPEGDATCVEDPLYLPDPGVVLLCCTTPKTSVVLDL
ncbi:MAG: hypothetical protein AB7H70_10965 [Rhodospirillaceae bacterium]